MVGFFLLYVLDMQTHLAFSVLTSWKPAFLGTINVYFTLYYLASHQMQLQDRRQERTLRIHSVSFSTGLYWN
jgi:hypothetical protein